MMRQLILSVCLLVLAFGAKCDVLHSADDGFDLRIEVSVAATPEEAYSQFLRIGEWWSSDHTWFGDAANLSIKPEAGGCFCEKDGDKSVQHLMVAYVEPNREIRLLGGLGPLQQMGLHGVLTFKFVAVSDSETKIVQLYRVTGYDPNGLKGLAPIVDQVQTLQLKKLAGRLAAPS